MIARVFGGKTKRRVELVLEHCRVNGGGFAAAITTAEGHFEIGAVTRNKRDATMQVAEQPPVVPLGRTAPARIGLASVVAPGAGPGLGIGKRFASTAIIEEPLVLLDATLPRFHFAAGMKPTQAPGIKILLKLPAQIRRNVIPHKHASVR